MASIIARLEHVDGKYHYGLSTTPAPHLGPLYQITVSGIGDLPVGPRRPQTPEEHKQWIQTLESRGFDVIVVPIEEPAGLSEE